jgi:putative transposase
MATNTFYRNRLPHWTPVGATFFVTFRTQDSLPGEVLLMLHKRLEEIKHQLLHENHEERKRLLYLEQKRLFGRFDAMLDNLPQGRCVLKLPGIAAILKERIESMHGQWYDLHAYTIMPNHVHILIDLSCQLREETLERPYIQLDRIMQHIKGGSSRFINLELGEKGRFWAKDSYDHWVRDEQEWERIHQYILNNPVKAGLVADWKSWPYSHSCRP